MDGEVSREFIGVEEDVNGFPTELFEVTIDRDGQRKHYYQRVIRRLHHTGNGRLLSRPSASHAPGGFFDASSGLAWDSYTVRLHFERHHNGVPTQATCNPSAQRWLRRVV
jgi:hypothetical protein